MKLELMTNELRSWIRSRPWPKDRPKGLELALDVDTVEWVGEEYHPHLAFILYRDNFNLFTPDQQMLIANIMQEVHKKVRDSGIPTTLEVKPYVAERYAN